VIRVQNEAFDPGAEINAFCEANASAGAVATFIGQVRDYVSKDASTKPVSALTLEHYPAMTTKELERVVSEASNRWALDNTLVIHRFGTLRPSEAIVLVCTASAHRGDAFSGCEFIMDWLKTSAPFWKKEASPDGESWVEARDSDDERAARWNAK